MDGYQQPDHPCQQLSLEAVAAVSGVRKGRIGTATDGCGVVSFALPLHAIARAFANLADPSGLTDVPLRGALTRADREARRAIVRAGAGAGAS